MKFYKNKYTFGKMCQILKVDRSSCYKWLKRGKSTRQQYNEKLLVLIRHEYITSGCLYGSPKITAHRYDISTNLLEKRVIVSNLKMRSGVQTPLTLKQRLLQMCLTLCGKNCCNSRNK